MTAEPFLVVIGGGPAGTAAALAAREHGRTVILIERQQRLARYLAEVALAEELAVRPLSRAPDQRRADGFTRAVRRAGEVAHALVDGREQRLRRAGVARVVGWARLRGEPGAVEIDMGSGATEVIRAEHVLLAVGSRPGATRCTADAAVRDGRSRLLDGPAPPRSAVVIGGGREGVALASLLCCCGTLVTLVESGSRLLEDADEDVALAVQRALEGAGCTLRLGTRATAVDRGPSGWQVQAGASPLLADAVLLAGSRQPALDGIGLERVGLDRLEPLEIGGFRTRLSWLLAAGTAAGHAVGPEAAWREGRAAVSLLAGGSETVPVDATPTIVTGVGGCGWVGPTEAQARRRGHALLVGRAAIPGRGRIAPGFAKVVVDRGSQRILGVHVAGAQGREAVALGAVLVEHGLSRQDLARMAFPAGSPAQALVEAASSAEPA